MVERTSKYTGLALQSVELDHTNFTVTNADNLTYIPGVNGGITQLRIDAEGGDAPLWKSIDYTVAMDQFQNYYTNLLTSEQGNCTGGWEVRGRTITNLIPANPSDAYESYAHGASIASSAELRLSGTIANAWSNVPIQHHGNNSMRIQANGANANGDSYASPGDDSGAMRCGMEAGKTYTISAWLYMGGTTPVTPDHPRGHRVVVFHSTDGGATYTEEWTNAATSNATWTKLTKTFTLPTGTNRAFIRLYNGHINTYNMYYDEIQLTETDGPVTWMLGGTSVQTSTLTYSTDTPATGWPVNGTSSAKAVTLGYANYEGMRTSMIDALPNQEYSSNGWILGPAGNVIQVGLYPTSDGSTTGSSIGTQEITCDGTPQFFQVTGTTPVGTIGLYLYVRHYDSDSAPPYYSGTFYVDKVIVNEGLDAEWITGGTTSNYGEPFEFYTELYGLTNTGTLEFIGENIHSSDVTTTETSHIYNFDLLDSACRTKFTKLSATGTTGKIHLDLPMRTNYYDNFSLGVNTYTGYQRYKQFNITSVTGVPTAGCPQNIIIPYDSDMANDFSDLCLVNSSGTKIPFAIFDKTNGTECVISTQVSNPPVVGASDYYRVWYKRSTTDPTSQLTNMWNIYTYWDDFEDCISPITPVTGRTAPYLNWTVRAGPTPTATTANKMRGTRSFQLAGTATSSIVTHAYTAQPYGSGPVPDGSVVMFDYKLKARGNSGTSPDFNIFMRYVDAINYLNIGIYYNGTNQRVKLSKCVAGTTTVLQDVSMGTRWAAGRIGTIRVIDGGTSIWVVVDGTRYISYAIGTLSMATTNKGIGVYGNGDTLVIDSYRVYPYSFYEPTFGALGTEVTGQYDGTNTVTTTPSDTPVLNTQEITFTTPAGLTASSTGNISYQEKGKGSLTGDTVKIADAGKYDMGYNGLDAYKTLILRFVVNGQDYNVNINNVTARYEI